MGRQARKNGLHDFCLFNQRLIQCFFGPCGQSAKEEKGTERVSEEKVTDYLPPYNLPDIGPPRSNSGLITTWLHNAFYAFGATVDRISGWQTL